MFYRGTVENILSSCIIVWFGNCTISDCKSLKRIVRAAEKIIRVSLPSIMDIYTTRCIHKVPSIVDDPTHPSHRLFPLLPSCRSEAIRWVEEGEHVGNPRTRAYSCDTQVEVVGECNHEIPVVDDIPVRQRYRRLPPSQYEQVKAHIQELVDREMVRVSCSPYSSPIVVVQKKDGAKRLCVDYRQLNAKTRKDAYPLPRIEESLDGLAGAQLFSTLDLTSGYNQVPMAEKDKQKTAFCTPFGLFEFNRMPFGLCNSPSTFQRLMERIFGDERFHSLLLYLDDTVIFFPFF
ncbi:hypothetical protein NFI96_007692 [Prochilodus magdalenae]|nr:hypothetical protein NFI96_007692 [Prochilodus magdalenae]